MSVKEEKNLISLLKKVKFPVGYELFLSIMNTFPSCPVEIAVFNKKNQVLLFYREDLEYKGYHSPGTVLRNDESVSIALDRLICSELQEIKKVDNIISLGWHETPKGSAYGQNPSRHEISLLHAFLMQGDYKGEGVFFDINNLPENTISHHKVLIPEIFRRFKKN